MAISANRLELLQIADAVAREKSIDRAEKQLVEECEKPGGVRCRVASFFEGSQVLRITELDLDDGRYSFYRDQVIGDPFSKGVYIYIFALDAELARLKLRPYGFQPALE